MRSGKSSINSEDVHSGIISESKERTHSTTNIFDFIAGRLVSIISSKARIQIIKGFVGDISDSSLETNLQEIAGSECEGRMAAIKGDGLAVQYIAHRFSAYRGKSGFSPLPFTLMLRGIGHFQYPLAKCSNLAE
jgi:hypothetical protein